MPCSHELYRAVEPTRYQRKLKQLGRTAAVAKTSPSPPPVVATEADQPARVA